MSRLIGERKSGAVTVTPAGARLALQAIRLALPPSAIVVGHAALVDGFEAKARVGNKVYSSTQATEDAALAELAEMLNGVGR